MSPVRSPPFSSAHAMCCSRGAWPFAQPWVPVTGDKIALERCQILLAEPGAAAGLRVLLPCFPSKSMLGHPHACGSLNPRSSGRCPAHLPCWIQHHKDPVCGCLGGTATWLAVMGLAPGCCGQPQPGLAILTFSSWNLYKYISVYVYIYIDIYAHMYTKINGNMKNM